MNPDHFAPTRWEAAYDSVDSLALEVLGQAMRECPEEPIEAFFGVSPQHPDYDCFVVALTARGVDWRKST